VKPGEHEQQLRALRRALLDKLRHHERLVGARQVLAHAGRRLEGGLERLLQDNWREGAVLLRGKPEPEIDMRLERLRKQGRVRVGPIYIYT